MVRADTELAADVTDRSSLLAATASLLGKLRLEFSRDPDNGGDGDASWWFGLWRRFLLRADDADDLPLVIARRKRWQRFRHVEVPS